MWRNNMQAIAQIGAMTRPQVRNMPTLDLNSAVGSYYDAKDAATKRAEAEAEKQRRQAYVEELTAQHPEAAARIAVDPAAYANYLDEQAKAERDQQYKLDYLNKQFNNSLALADRQNANSIGLARVKQQLANQAASEEKAARAAQLDEALNSGMITQEEYNLIKRRELLGDIVKGTSANMDNPFDKAMVQNFAKDYSENVKKAQSTFDDYAAADRLLDKIETGGIYSIPAVANSKAVFNPDVAQFIAAQNKLIPTMRPTGSGSTSDKDMAIFAKATFGIDKPKEANRNIIRGRMAAAENEVDYNQLKAQWISAGGSPVAFDQEWNQYLEQNPIFSSDSGALNKRRVSGRKWFNAPKTNNNSDNVVDASEYFK